ncbi:ATP-dependent DNA ligase [Terfezia boudieri ATCC MYA-4762]|uniref:DNA ligase 1 n=1 Tax=Terfezia boudieri ATCC MYA-4762 TaxID=1051890 RepID=A0A3N4L933_9PEZI|nr:ATP-dependent DNA ligase [Terfezia boudieri ATCC MYA-4762]
MASIEEEAKSEPESESEALKPAKRRRRPPKAAEVAEDMQKVKISEKETKNTKAKKKENENPDLEEKPKKSKSSPKKSPKKVSPVVKAEPIEEKKNDDEAPVSDSESPSSSEESSLKKPAITAAARKQVQAKLVSGGHSYPDWPTGSPVPYAALCKSFSLIENTTKRLEKLQHTSLLLRQVLRLTPNELLLVVHLMCNKLAADFEGIELGIGESLLIKAIAESCGRAIDKIKSDHNQIGDLGVVAQQSRSNQSTLMFHKPKQLTVARVHDTFLKIAITSGGGAQNGKVSLIKQLLASAAKEGDEAKYIVRALEGKMRLGLAERTIEVALSQAVVTWEQEKSDKKPSLAQLQEAEEILKGVYSELPSFEVIIPALIEHGIYNLRQYCRMQPGVPLKPMLAKPTKAITEVLDKFENKTFTCEYKYDGERSQIHFVSKTSKIDYPKTAVDTNKIDKGVAKIFSRNSEDLSKKYPDILGVLDSWIKPGVESFILDCETVGWDKEEKKVLPFQQLMTRKKKDVIVEDVKVKVCVFAFDLLFLNGKPLVKETLQERRRLMYESFNEIEGQFSFAKAMDGNELEQIQSFLDESIKDSCEGLMVKMLLGSESSYEPSVRSINWLKIKKDYLAGVGDSLDLVVVGAYFGRGKRTSVYGAFLLACYNSSKQTYETICNIGTGFSEQVLEEHYKALSEHVIDRPKPYYSHSTGNTHAPDVWFEPKMVWEVKTADMTLSPKYRAAEGLVDSNKGISLRFPRFLRIRDDKGPEQATNARQVAEMYRKQESVGGGKKGVDDDFEY